ncbi:MAG: ComEC/Rec2 family competence protein [Candidatus Levybacteria bacterium]|nr:ComEC/Rec2 family competence protein [Candidatus Levybacteria bacterium]
MTSARTLFIAYCIIIATAFLRVILYVAPSALMDGSPISRVVRVESQTAYKDTYHSFRTHIDGAQVRVVFDRYTVYEQGEKLRIVGSIRNTVLDNGRTMSSIYNPKIETVPDGGVLYDVRIWIRQRVTEAYATYLPPDEAHLLMGIVFGINTGFSSKLTDAFAINGVMHVIAASGMNVTLLGGFISAISARYFRRRAALFLTIGALLLYAFLAGLGASIVRATIMGSIAFGAGIFGRQNTARIALLVTGLLMLIISPELLYDVGFQLSFAATIGIMWLRECLPNIGGALGELISEDLGSTLSAQLTTFPIILFYFHSIGLLSPIINILVLWIVPPVMMMGLSAAVLGLLSPTIGAIITLPTWPFLGYFLFIVREGSKLSPAITINDLPGSLIAAYYLILFCAYRFVSKRRRSHVQA